MRQNRPDLALNRFQDMLRNLRRSQSITREMEEQILERLTHVEKTLGEQTMDMADAIKKEPMTECVSRAARSEQRPS